MRGLGSLFPNAPHPALSLWEREFYLCREADVLFQTHNAIFMLLDLVREGAMQEVMFDVLRNNVEIVTCLFSFSRYPFCHFFHSFFHICKPLRCLLVVLPHLLHEEVNVLLRCRRLLIRWHA